MKYLEEDYTISFYKNSSKEFIVTQPSSSMTQSVFNEPVTESVFNNYTWVHSTGASYHDWAIISGAAEIAFMNPNNASNNMSYSDIGTRIAIRGDDIFTNVYRNSTSEKNNGIAMYRSSSAGWALSDYLNIPTASVSNKFAARIAIEFSLDDNKLIVPVGDTNAKDSKLLIYNSSSTGWNLEQTLTTGSYNDGAAVDETQGDYSFMTAVIKGDTIFANGFYSGYYDRFVAFFKSSSAGGWTFEDNVQTGDSSQTGFTNTNGSIGISGVCFDFDGTTAVVGSVQGEGNEWYHNDSGKVHIIESSSAGWGQTKVGLYSLGYTSSVTSYFGSSNARADQEYRTWTMFGYKACSVSGSYIAAAAEGEEIYNSATSNYTRQKNSVFILKTSSAGWLVDARLDDPAENLILSGAQNESSNTEFGAGLVLDNNCLVVNSPLWATDEASGEVEGRMYVYVSSSSGWDLDQVINNPYSGSVFQSYGSSGVNMKLTHNSQGGFSNAGYIGFNSKPAVSGNLLVMPAPSFGWHSASDGLSHIGGGVYASTIYGAMIPIYGSASYYQHKYTQEVTKSVRTTTLVEMPGGPVPMRVGLTKGTYNLRNQTKDNSYTTFKP